VTLATTGPSTKASGAAIAEGNYVGSYWVKVWVPYPDYQAPVNGSKNVMTTNSVLNFNATSMSAQLNTETNITNNTVQYGFIDEKSTPPPGACSYRNASSSFFTFPQNGASKAYPGDNVEYYYRGGVVLPMSNTIDNYVNTVTCFSVDSNKAEFSGFTKNKLINLRSNPATNVYHYTPIYPIGSSEIATDNFDELNSQLPYAVDETNHLRDTYPGLTVEYSTDPTSSLETTNCGCL
jgi:hypothetical protein